MKLRAAMTMASLAVLAASAHAQRFVPQSDPEHPRIKYADSLESVNDRCIVKKTKLSLAIRPVYVNWRPIGFCCEGCPALFLKNPEKYLTDQKIDLRCVVPLDIESWVRLRDAALLRIGERGFEVGARLAHRGQNRVAGAIYDSIHGALAIAGERLPQSPNDRDSARDTRLESNR